MTPKNTVCLWFDREALGRGQILRLRPFRSSVGAVLRAPGDFPDGKEGDEVLTVEFTRPTASASTEDRHSQSQAFSFQIATDDQAETDRLLNAIVDNGGEESACGWCKDKWGLSWQITPRALTEGMADPIARWRSGCSTRR